MIILSKVAPLSKRNAEMPWITFATPPESGTPRLGEGPEYPTFPEPYFQSLAALAAKETAD
jgi:hypothetical protein